MKEAGSVDAGKTGDTLLPQCRWPLADFKFAAPGSFLRAIILVAREYATRYPCAPSGMTRRLVYSLVAGAACEGVLQLVGIHVFLLNNERR